MVKMVKDEMIYHKVVNHGRYTRPCVHEPYVFTGREDRCPTRVVILDTRVHGPCSRVPVNTTRQHGPSRRPSVYRAFVIRLMKLIPP